MLNFDFMETKIKKNKIKYVFIVCIISTCSSQLSVFCINYECWIVHDWQRSPVFECIERPRYWTEKFQTNWCTVFLSLVVRKEKKASPTI